MPAELQHLVHEHSHKVSQLCWLLAKLSPQPLVAVKEVTHMVRCVKFAFVEIHEFTLAYYHQPCVLASGSLFEKQHVKTLLAPTNALGFDRNQRDDFLANPLDQVFGDLCIGEAATWLGFLLTSAWLEEICLSRAGGCAVNCAKATL